MMAARKKNAAKGQLTDIGDLDLHQNEASAKSAEPVKAEPEKTVEAPRNKRGRRAKSEMPVKMSSVGKYRAALGMTQAEMAAFLRTTPSTLNVWERDVDGDLADKRGSSYFIFECVKALINQSFKTPDMINPADLKKFFQAGAGRNLAKHYIPVSNFLDDDFLRIINSGNLIGVVFALLADEYFRKTGRTAPGELMLKMQDINKEIAQKDENVDEENLDKLSAI